ncbi:nucleotidyltransferase domain-containing protein [Leptothermofonsia sichuanensis E412]|uniref:nucleotidyltransferase family protein n=1 Tax=Leptothermofonsia sichuanensis TaxID=2917832 RepID=UPI001CA63341|nr:nucleotidyltransferase domain-containing protein [Leptothermofonsia sichuanensis]QZZ22879.1 nucleotidyltransferase domain-containing protein [Leptothermofonsia sichuanensis E412]
MAKIPTEQMQRYILTARRREQQRLAALQQRRSRGLEVAQQAARLLKQEFAATRVVLFGSLLSEPFHETSDIDLAVWGLSAKSYFQAVGQLLSLSEFEFDLVEAEFASPEILAAIAHGVEL